MGKKRITEVAPGSPAARAGIRPEERLVSVNGHDILDALDYRFYGAEAGVRLEIEGADGRVRALTLDNGAYEDLGLSFETYLMDRHRSCCNNCLFCFVDQLPCGMRKSLYFKDDDERLSLLFGNYVTLTNLSPRAFQRIIDLHISPINVSVHATDPEVRVRLMGNRFAGRIMAQLRTLCEAGLEVNCQLVICPDINDGAVLERSLSDLCALGPQIHSVALIPLGMTAHREGLAPLKPVDEACARAVCALAERFADRCKAERGLYTVYAADEFYLKARLPLPAYERYEDFPQLDNGVGMMATTEREFTDALRARRFPLLMRRQTVTLVTGMAAEGFIRRLAEAAEKKSRGRLRLQVAAVRNDFFGPSVDVAGLLTGRDIRDQLVGRALGCRVVIPGSCLKTGEDVFLDDMTLGELRAALGVPVLPSGRTGAELLGALCGEEPPRYTA